MKRILSMSALCAMLVFTSCKDETYTVTFDSQGGSAVATITNIVVGEKITQPTTSIKNGFDFGG